MPIDIRTVMNLTTGSTAKKTSATVKMKGQSDPSAPSAETDSVSLTDTVSVLGRAQELLASVSVVNTDRVSMVADAITMGDYEIDSEQVAEKIIESEKNHPS